VSTEETPPGEQRHFKAVDPRNGNLISSHACLSSREVEAVLQGACKAQKHWASTPVEERSALLALIAQGFVRERRALARTISLEMGKPITQADAEVDKCVAGLEYYAEIAPCALAPVTQPTAAKASYWTCRPLGIVLGIMPWNFPAWQVVRFVAPQLALGNVVLVKHAENVPATAMILERLFRAEGGPEGIYSNLFVQVDAVGGLIDDRRISGVSLTGSVQAGRAVAARAGRALKKCVLELGGSDPAIVLADADMQVAVEGCLWGRIQNTGQSCIASKRFIVVRDVLEEFRQLFLARLREVRVGDPLDHATELGPMARLDLRDELHRQVTESVAAGATLLTGGSVPDRPGFWYPPTMLDEVAPSMPAYTEELFGPVAALIPVEDEEEAVRVANDSAFGLGAAVYTEDVERGEMIARERLEAGNCFVNGMVRSDPRLPFGGIKHSGYGRELSPLGLAELANVKTVWVE